MWCRQQLNWTGLCKMFAGCKKQGSYQIWIDNIIWIKKVCAYWIIPEVVTLYLKFPSQIPTVRPSIEPWSTKLVAMLYCPGGSSGTPIALLARITVVIIKTDEKQKQQQIMQPSLMQPMNFLRNFLHLHVSLVSSSMIHLIIKNWCSSLSSKNWRGKSLRQG